MKRTIITIVAAFLASVLAFTGITAASNGQAKDNRTTTVSQNQTVDGAFYGASDFIVVNGTVNGDVYCAGQNIIIDGTVNGDVLCAGQIIRIAGTVSGDVRVAGQNISIDGAVAGNVSALGQNVVVGENATVGRDLNGAVQTVTVNGEIGRDMGLAGGQAIINGQVGRNFNGYYDNVTVASGAVIAGDAIFEGNSATIADGAVSGETKRTTAVIDAQRQMGDYEAVINVLQFFMLFVLALVLVLLLPGHIRRATNVSAGRFWLGALLGLVVIIVTPIAAILFALTIVGLPVAALLMLGWCALLLVSLPVFSYYIGRQILRTKVKNAVAVMAVGALIVLIAVNIPWIGGLIAFIGSLAGVGMVTHALSRRWVKPDYTA